jgi:pyruvate-ferredoxin/flavodoxin oxidoreductase
VPFVEFARTQARFSLLERANPAAAAHLFALAQHDIDERWHLYEQLGEMERWADDEVDDTAVTVSLTGDEVNP